MWSNNPPSSLMKNDLFLSREEVQKSLLRRETREAVNGAIYRTVNYFYTFSARRLFVNWSKLGMASNSSSSRAFGLGSGLTWFT